MDRFKFFLKVGYNYKNLTILRDEFIITQLLIIQEEKFSHARGENFKGIHICIIISFFHAPHKPPTHMFAYTYSSSII